MNLNVEPLSENSIVDRIVHCRHFILFIEMAWCVTQHTFILKDSFWNLNYTWVQNGINVAIFELHFEKCIKNL